MPKPKLLTARRVCNLPAAVDRQLERIAAAEATTVQELMRRAFRQTYGPPSDDDHHASLFDQGKGGAADSTK